MIENERPLRNEPDWVLRYFAPCLIVGIPYRLELAARDREQREREALKDSGEGTSDGP